MTQTISIGRNENDEAGRYSERAEAHPRNYGTRECSGEEIAKALTHHATDEQPYCIYVHIPYCKFRCSFCALYTKLLKEDAKVVTNSFVRSLLDSIDRHPWGAKPIAPTTVHFGGGTPLSIGTAYLAEVVARMRRKFKVDDNCEWAIETTTSSISKQSIDELWNMGFRRIHLGVQTLEDDIRVKVGRQENSREVLSKIRGLIERGFHVSVDLILGLVGTNEITMRRDVHRLYAVGIRMFSICELRLQRGRPSQDEHSRNYRVWRVLWAELHALELMPIHIGQFGRNYDDNRYFTHPARGEACMVLGPYGHGSFADYSYQNYLLGSFERQVANDRIPIREGFLHADQEVASLAFERALLAHRIQPGVLIECLQRHETDLYPLLKSWDRAGYLLTDKASGELTLSCEGSWYVGNLVQDFRELTGNSRAA